LRLSLLLELTMSGVTIGALLVAWSTHSVLWYGWALTISEMCAASVALWLVAPLLAAGWPRQAVYPPLVASLMGGASVVAVRTAFPPTTAFWHVVETTTAFSCVAVLTCRLLFPATFSSLLRIFPGHQIVPGWLAGDAARA